MKLKLHDLAMAIERLETPVKLIDRPTRETLFVGDVSTLLDYPGLERGCVSDIDIKDGGLIFTVK